MIKTIAIGVVGILLLAQAEPPAKPQATSLLGKPLYAGPASPEAIANLNAAREASAKAPRDADALIWVGRRLGYLQQFREAIGIYSKALDIHPSDARISRHRGHRYISVREFDNAIADLSKAADLVKDRPDEVEPDGQPNARGIPTSTLKTNIYYHLGLAHYLKADFASALAAYRECEKHSKNADMTVATSHWLYMTLRRLGRDAEARQVLDPISAKMDVFENGSYHRLLLMYKGEADADGLLASAKAGGVDAGTIGYGVGNWHFYNGRKDRAQEIFRAIVDQNASQWPAFGYVAAEAEVARSKHP
jgi:TolA-binding protein